MFVERHLKHFKHYCPQCKLELKEKSINFLQQKNRYLKNEKRLLSIYQKKFKKLLINRQCFVISNINHDESMMKTSNDLIKCYKNDKFPWEMIGNRKNAINWTFQKINSRQYIDCIKKMQMHDDGKCDVIATENESSTTDSVSHLCRKCKRFRRKKDIISKFDADDDISNSSRANSSQDQVATDFDLKF